MSDAEVSVPQGPVADFIIGLLKLVESRPPQSWEEFQVEVGAILRQRPAQPIPPGMDAPEAAEALIDKAWDDEENAAELAIEALRLDLSCVDAWVVLGEECGDEHEIAVLLFTFGVMVGREALGEEFETLAGQFFEEPKTQPFMRAIEGLSRTCFMLGDLQTASAHYSTMLELNPKDHQGARYPLLAILLAAKEATAAATLLKVYEDDDSAAWSWGRALTLFQQEGNSPAADAALATANKQLPGASQYLSGNKAVPTDGVVSPEEAEALTVAMMFGPAWLETVGAKEWLMRGTGTVGTPPAKAKRSGPRSID